MLVIHVVEIECKSESSGKEAFAQSPAMPRQPLAMNQEDTFDRKKADTLVDLAAGNWIE